MQTDLDIVRAKWEQILKEHGLGVYQGVGLGGHPIVYVADYHENTKPFHYSAAEKIRCVNPNNAERLRKFRKDHPELARRYKNDYRRRKREAQCTN